MRKKEKTKHIDILALNMVAHVWCQTSKLNGSDQSQHELGLNRLHLNEFIGLWFGPIHGPAFFFFSDKI